MERVTITIDDQLLASVDRLAASRGYPSRSEAIRELIRDAAMQEDAKRGSAMCVAALSYVFDHSTRDLSQRLTEQQHDHHDLSVATTHIHFDHTSCLEVAILRGTIDRVRELADSMTVQRGVRQSALHIIPLKPAIRPHSHGTGGPDHEHGRL